MDIHLPYLGLQAHRALKTSNKGCGPFALIKCIYPYSVVCDFQKFGVPFGHIDFGPLAKTAEPFNICTQKYDTEHNAWNMDR